MTDERTKEHPHGVSQKPNFWDDFFDSPGSVTDDFMAAREQPEDQERGTDDDFMKERPEILDEDRVIL